MASCMAENGLNEPVIGVTFDGTGFGTDGAIWGGEFLAGDYRGLPRAAHLRYVGMPGGEQAIREPWRMAAAYLADAGHGDELLAGDVPAPALATARRLIDRQTNCPPTSSAGRLFDGMAALVGCARPMRATKARRPWSSSGWQRMFRPRRSPLMTWNSLKMPGGTHRFDRYASYIRLCSGGRSAGPRQRSSPGGFIRLGRDRG